jgi:hypothetical protein
LFPITEDEKHRGSDGSGGLQCGLLKLGDMVAEAKYAGMQNLVSKNVMSQKLRNNTLAGEKHKRQTEEKEKRRQEEEKARKRQKRESTNQVTEVNLNHSGSGLSTGGKTVPVKDGEADEDVPYFLRKFKEKHPFGNVHMALRVGPLVIENGVSQ